MECVYVENQRGLTISILASRMAQLGGNALALVLHDPHVAMLPIDPTFKPADCSIAAIFQQLESIRARVQRVLDDHPRWIDRIELLLQIAAEEIAVGWLQIVQIDRDLTQDGPSP
jgi:hypothetical protein